MKAISRVRSVLGKGSRTIAIALTLLLIALFIPPIALPRNTYTYTIFFDITQSMNVEDYELEGSPMSRLAYARHAVRHALRDLPCGSRIGLGAFAEYRALLMLAPIEVCGNYNDLLLTLDNIDGRMRWGNASEVAKGVFWSVRAAKEIGQNTNVIFLSDGHEAPPLRSSDHPIFEDVRAGEIRGWIIGVGSDTPRPIPKTDREGNFAGYWRADEVIQLHRVSATGAANPSREHLSGLREPHLQALARRIGFEYAPLKGLASVSEAMGDTRFAQRRSIPTDVYWLPAAIAVILLSLRFRPDFNEWSTRH